MKLPAAAGAHDSRYPLGVMLLLGAGACLSTGGLLLGSVQVGVGFLLITIGSRHVPAGEVPLFALTETVLAPIWVWLLVSEAPSLASLTGGALVLGAVCAAAMVGLRAQSRDRVRTAGP